MEEKQIREILLARDFLAMFMVFEIVASDWRGPVASCNVALPFPMGRVPNP